MNESTHGETTASEPQDRVAELIEQQTAISEVLRAIASSPHDMQPIFDAILDSATRLCRADISSLRLSEVSGVRRVALRGDPLLASQARSSIPVRVEKGAFRSRLAASRIPTHIPDLTALEGDRRDAFWITIVNSGLRTALVMPVLKDNEIVGTIALGRKQVQPFTDKQISLFRDFAAQAAIALESTRRGNIARCRARWRMPTASLPWASSPCRLLMKSSSSLRRHAHTPLLHSGF
jgi:GAF domain-containing protein